MADYSHWVTVYADGSVRAGAAQGGYALRGSFAPLHVRDTVDLRGVTDSNVAEILALAHGIRRAREVWPATIGFFLRSDSRTALRAVERRPQAPHLHRAWQELQEALRGIKPRRINCKWVAGHQDPNVSTQAYMNNVADALSRRPGGSTCA